MYTLKISLMIIQYLSSQYLDMNLCINQVRDN